MNRPNPDKQNAKPAKMARAGTSKQRNVKVRFIIVAIVIILVVAIVAAAAIILSQSQTTPPVQTSPGTEEYAVIETKFGKMVIRFFPQDAPRHVENFKKLARQGFYDSTTFHRVVPGFVIQGGDPNTKDSDRSNDGVGGPGYTVPAEFNSRSHKRGIVSMARGNDPNSAGSQFFIMIKDSSFLDRQYTVFGEVIRGMEVADMIVSQPRDGNENPINKVEMKVYVTTSL